jgi:precorrin-3B synthase
MLVRLRLVGGGLSAPALRRLLQVSARYGDGRAQLTRRANLQVRGLPGHDGRLPPAVLAAIAATGLLPVASHERARNILMSPQSGLAGGRADLRPVAHHLDTLICANPALAELPGRFLFTLDDGRGDLLDRLTGPGKRGTDLGLIVLGGDPARAQLRLGEHWGPVVGLASAARRLAGLAAEFLARRESAWHVRELDAVLRPPAPADPRIPGPAGPLGYGAVPGGAHLHVPDGILTTELAQPLLDAAHHGGLVVTPWHGIFTPQHRRQPQ